MSENGEGNERIQEVLRQLPSVDRLLMTPVAHNLAERFGRNLVVEALRDRLEALRVAILGGRRSVPMNAALVHEAQEWLEDLVAPTLRSVINATGVIVHTNLGRAPLSRPALAALQEVGGGYSTLEYDVQAGERGSRSTHASEFLQRITGAEAAFVANNNAAAVLLMLTALCRDGEVIISRGQLVEIGGGFRIPDVMAQSGARLVEVGTTNRTHLHDYADAIGEETAAILVAHHSNFKVVGFTSEPQLEELANLAHDNGLPLLYDQGSGALYDTAAYGLEREPTVTSGLRAGADVVAFSGDKLLGGPQAGILCGRQAHIDRIKTHPLARAVRPDKLCLAALSATLVHYLVGESESEVPVRRMMARPLSEVEETAERWAEQLREAGILVTVIDGLSTVGGGSLPGSTLPTKVVAIDHTNVEALSERLRQNDPCIVGRIQDNRFIVDPRTVMGEQEEPLLSALSREAQVAQGS